MSSFSVIKFYFIPYNTNMAADPTSIYSVSVDSRSRNPHDAENNYSIDLGQTLQRVKSVQLGSIQIPESRYTFTQNSQMNYMEPVTIPANCYVYIEEASTVSNRATGTIGTTTNRVAILLPPTLNIVTGFTLPNTVTLANDAGLDFALKYYPLSGSGSPTSSSSALNVKLVGGHYPQSLMTIPMPVPFPQTAGPVLTTNTIVGMPTANTYTYAPGYLAALNTGGNNNTRHYLAGTYTSYVCADPPLPVELFTMLNAAFDDLRSATPTLGAITNATFATPILITAGLPHGLKTQDQVTVMGVTGNTGANGSFFIVVTSPTQFQLTGSVGTAAYTGGGSFWSSRRLQTSLSIGFDDAESRIVFRGTDIVKTAGAGAGATVTTVVTRLLAGTGSFAELIGFGAGARAAPKAGAQATLPPSILRSISMKPGNYHASEVADILQTRMSPLVLSGTDSGCRTLFFIMPASPPWTPQFSVVLPQGRYTATQLVEYVNFYTQPAPLNVSMSFNAVTGRFTFAHNVGLVFGLDFSSVLSACMACTLGFEVTKYLGFNSYTSDRAVFGVDSGARFPQNVYRVGIDDSQYHFSFASNAIPPLEGMVSASGVNTPGTNATWQIGSFADWMPLTPVPVVQNLQPGDVVYVACPFFSDTIVSASFTSPIVITTTTVHGLTSTDSVSVSSVLGNTSANGAFSITVTGANTFELDGSVGNAAYVSGGIVSTNSVFLAGVQVATNQYTAIVKTAWDASGGTGLPAGSVAPTIVLEPTASLFSTLGAGTVDAAVGTPSVGPPLILVRLVSGHRQVFQLMFPNKGGLSQALGFPAVAWPPSARALQQVSTPTTVMPSGSYVSPFGWVLTPAPYILMILKFPGNTGDMNTHVLGEDCVSIFAKLYLKTSSYLHICDELLFSRFATVDKIEKINVEFRNPDGSLVEFNGVFHSFTLLFTLYQGTADGACF